MNVLVLPQPQATLAVTHKPCRPGECPIGLLSDTCEFCSAAPERALCWVVGLVDDPPVDEGDRIMIASEPSLTTAMGLLYGAIYGAAEMPLDEVVGTATVRMVLPIQDWGGDREKLFGPWYLLRVGEGWGRNSNKLYDYSGLTGDDITDQLVWLRPEHRWAVLLSDAAPADRRCPSCWTKYGWTDHHLTGTPSVPAGDGPWRTL